jgi:tetratricopeptide (TPR) repeat protein
MTSDRLRITAQLIRTEDGFHLWSEQYDRSRGDVFEIQEEIARAIVDRLRADVEGTEERHLAKRHTDDWRAHELYLKGVYSYERRIEGGFRRALDLFEQALKRDPGHALAHVRSARCYWGLGYWGFRPPHEIVPLARQAAERALEIDDCLVEAHSLRALIRFHYDWDWPEAEKLFRHAIALGPDNSEARSDFAGALGLMGRTDEAVLEAEQSRRLSPLSLPAMLLTAGSLQFARRHDEAIVRARETVELEPAYLLAHVTLGHISMSTGKYHEAIDAYERARVLSDNGALSLAWLAAANAVAGRRDRAMDIVDELLTMSEQRYVCPVALATPLFALGDERRALGYVRRACEGRDPFALFFKVEPAFDPMRDSPGFQEAIEMVGIWG